MDRTVGNNEALVKILQITTVLDNKRSLKSLDVNALNYRFCLTTLKMIGDWSRRKYKHGCSVVWMLLWDASGVCSGAVSRGRCPHLVVHLPRQILQLLSRILQTLPFHVVVWGVSQKFMQCDDVPRNLNRINGKARTKRPRRNTSMSKEMTWKSALLKEGIWYISSTCVCASKLAYLITVF